MDHSWVQTSTHFGNPGFPICFSTQPSCPLLFPTEVRHVAAASPEPATATAAVAGKPQGNKRKAPAPLERQTESAAGGSSGTAAGKSTDKLPVSPSKTQTKAAVAAMRKTDKKGSAAPDSSSAPAPESAKAGNVTSKGGGGSGLNVGAGSREGGGLGQAKGSKRKLQAPLGGEETSVVAAVAPQSTLQQVSLTASGRLAFFVFEESNRLCQNTVC